MTEPVIMEVLAGARTQAREDGLRRLMRCRLATFDPAADFDAAVTIYRRCHRVGVTPRGLVDCMIAAVCWRRGATPLAHDADLDRVAEVIGLGLDDATLRPDRESPCLVAQLGV